MAGITLSGLTPGTTIFIRFWKYNGGTGTFGLCVTAPLVPTEQDCLNAIPVCTSQFVNPISYSGTGNIPNEINTFTSCLNTGELKGVPAAPWLLKALPPFAPVFPESLE